MRVVSISERGARGTFSPPTLVPVILNRPLNDAYRYRSAGAPLKSYQVFDYAINGTL